MQVEKFVGTCLVILSFIWEAEPCNQCRGAYECRFIRSPWPEWVMDGFCDHVDRLLEKATRDMKERDKLAVQCIWRECCDKELNIFGPSFVS